MRTLVLAGDDKLGRSLLHRIEKAGLPAGELVLALCSSPGPRRLFKLLLRGSLKLSWLWPMIRAEWSRPAQAAGSWFRVSTNAGFLSLIRETHSERVLLYRAGLIVGKDVLESGVEILNVHCAQLPDFG